MNQRYKKKLAAAQRDLADREVDLVSYDRVLADMRRRQLSPFGGTQSIAIVNICRDATARDCESLREAVAELERKVTS